MCTSVFEASGCCKKRCCALAGDGECDDKKTCTSGESCTGPCKKGLVVGQKNC